MALVCWYAPGKGHVVPVGDDFRIQRRDFTWQQKKYPDMKFIDAEEGPSVPPARQNFFLTRSDVLSGDRVAHEAYMVHPNIGITEERRDRRTQSVPSDVQRLMEMWRAAAEPAAEVGDATGFDACHACGSCASYDGLQPRKCALCLCTLHFTCAKECAQHCIERVDGAGEPAELSADGEPKPPKYFLPALFVGRLCAICETWAGGAAGAAVDDDLPLSDAGTEASPSLSDDDDSGSESSSSSD